MSTKTVTENSILELNKLVLEGQLLPAFEKYYHRDVQMQENDLPPTIGKDRNRMRETEFLNNVLELRKMSVVDVAVSDNMSAVIWDYDYTHKEWGVKNYRQVSVQTWKDGQIIHEQFIYPAD